ncbi:UDP-forming cellulose synthase catalytic subunit [Phenylobacterium sp. J426]|uniref:UDP-forming cellulose synthase catalytic subunit n=1 Tax=Phenylobacterium sp. J426 TaxID=2898439 RepID=UPI0021513AD6|nr:UDP-forming cellulose synthase catalytic subunit [Phenylobacterium sp. J426]MCR5876551.1 UDP-forming cellulose synthase catalytic subunit [Phenylobacterium sp. J426]
MRPLLASKPVQAILLVASATLILLAILVPLDREAQLIFGLAVFAAAAVLAQRSASRRMTLLLVVISTVLSTRYIWWRLTQTLHFDNPLSMGLGIGLFLAELYAWLILVLGYVQCVWPLERNIRELVGPPETWPTVDIYVPTYNESLDIVQDTVFAAMDQDYPPDRYRVYILDDGRRPEFEAFAKAVGCGYLTRGDNLHAKAGNLNAAMKRTDGELICVFDADHVATRAFLQFTVGWFQADPKLALLQTPHFFYSPDPVQRNVVAVKDIPGEGDLFYGIVQKGNDFWNAAFFCGSCAIIRRRALAATNGFAGETVTEDAHTALKLQRMGWNTAYLNARLSAGLATERLALHVGQRARWARGMTQIFRIDNPLFGRGLSFGQRLCYLNAMLHFQFPLPRIVFLTSPLAYLLLGQNIIAASALTILAFAGPHLLFAVLVNERVQGRYRRAFWGEVYEALISFHLVGPAILPLIDPKRGKFNVTDKGGLLEEGYFDYKVLMPHLITVGLLTLGITVGLVKMAFPKVFDAAPETILLNVAWSVFSLLILLTCLAVGRETRQVRTRAHLDAELPVRLYFEDGHIAAATTANISMGGMAVNASPEALTEGRIVTHVEVEAAERRFGFPVQTLGINGGRLRLQFTDMSLEARRELVRVVMGRADAWPAPDDLATWSAWQSFLDLCRASLSVLFWWRLERGPQKPRSWLSRLLRPAAAAALLLAAPLAGSPAKAQTAPAATPGAPAAPQAGQPTQVSGRGARTVSLTLEDLAQSRPLRLISTLGEAGVPFSLRQDEVVTQAQLVMNFAYSPQLLSDLSHLSVLMNDEIVGTIPLASAGAGGVTVTLPIDPGLFTNENRLGFRFVGHYTRGCEDPLHSTLWANISNTRTRLILTLQKLSVGDTLSRLPAPMFDESDPQPLRLPFIFAGPPSNELLASAAAVSSYFGMNASFRGFRFPVSYGALPPGDGVVVARAGAQVGGWTAPPVSGPSVSLVRNPNNPYATLLVVSGPSDADVLSAARVLAAAPKSLSGQSALVSPLPFAKRRPYDAPRWVDTRRPVRLGELVSPANLEGYGLRPGLLTAEFRTAPDLFFWPQTGAKLSFSYRYPAGPWLDYNMSRLDVLTNDKYIRSITLRPDGAVERARDLVGASVIQQKAAIDIPGYNIFGQNQLQFFYDLHVTKKGACQGEIPTGVRTGIDANSKLDLSHAHHFSRLPDLAFFAGAGFPFTRVADLSETLALLPDSVQPADVEALLALAGRFGDATGAPAIALNVARVGQASNLTGRDLLVIGPLALTDSALFRESPVRGDGGRLRVASTSLLGRMFARFGSNVDRPDPAAADAALVTVSDFAGVVSWRSPFDPERVVVAVLSANPQRRAEIVYALEKPAANAAMQGDLAVATGTSFTSFRVAPGFWSGKLPWHVGVMWWASRNPLFIALGLLAAAAVVGLAIWAVMSALERTRLRDAGGEG